MNWLYTDGDMNLLCTCACLIWWYELVYANAWLECARNEYKIGWQWLQERTCLDQWSVAIRVTLVAEVSSSRWSLKEMWPCPKMETLLVMQSWTEMIVYLLLWCAQRSFWAAQISVCQCVARLWKETSTACLQLCLKWTLVVLCYSARPCYDIVTCCCAGEMNIVSNIWSLFSCACLTFNMCYAFWADEFTCVSPKYCAPKSLNINMCHAG